MSDISLDVNLAELSKALDVKEEKLVQRMKRGTVLGMRDFEARMIRRFFSGRPGLRRRTGTAAKSWHIVQSQEAGDFVVHWSNRPNAFYIVQHQRGGTIYARRQRYLHFKGDRGWARVRSVQIPKRLYIPEHFRRLGPSIFRKHIRQQLIYAK